MDSAASTILPLRASADARRPLRVLFLNRSYWPDGEATGQLLTELAEDLAGRGFDITVIAGQPNSNPSGESHSRLRHEMRHGVRILRVPHTRFDKASLAGRLANYLTFVAGAAVRAICCRRADVIVAQSDPFLLALVGHVANLRHRAWLVQHVQDIHPDVGVAVGRLRESALTRLVRRVMTAAYRAADRILVPSGDMRQTMLDRGVPEASVVRVPNWADTRAVRPVTAGQFRSRVGIPEDTFLVMYSGNFGLTQRLDGLLHAADLLRSRSDIAFALVGGGGGEAALRSEAERLRLPNVRFLPSEPKDRLAESLSAADLQVITVHPAALNYLMPSKLYGILAAGRPVLATASDGTELAEEIRTNGVGFVVPPDDTRALARVIEHAADRRADLVAYGERARRLAENRYDRCVIVQRYAELLHEVYEGRTAFTSRQPSPEVRCA